MKVSDHKKGSVQKPLIYEINYTFLLYLISIRFSLPSLSVVHIATMRTTRRETVVENVCERSCHVNCLWSDQHVTQFTDKAQGLSSCQLTFRILVEFHLHKVKEKNCFFDKRKTFYPFSVCGIWPFDFESPP